MRGLALRLHCHAVHRSRPQSSEIFFIPENKARAHSGGACFTRQAGILHAECLCQKGFQSSERLFQNLDEQNKGLTLRTSAIIYFRGNMSNKKSSMLTISLTEKASMWGASCETRKGFALRTVVTKGIHFGGIVSNKKGSMLTTSLT